MLKAFDPMSLDAEIKGETVTLTFVGSPPRVAAKFLNGLPDTPGADREFLAAVAADEATATLVEVVPEAWFLSVALLQKYRERLAQVAGEIAGDPKSSAV